MTIVANKYDKGYISKFNPFVSELNDLYLYPLEAVIVIHHFKLMKMTLERILGGTAWIYMYLLCKKIIIKKIRQSVRIPLSR